MIKYLDEFRNTKTAKYLAEQIADKILQTPVKLMEICGGHTLTIMKYGIRNLLPESIQLISGPGCPVCVTHQDYIDSAIALSGIKNMIITTFGDMMKVPGSTTTLNQQKSKGYDIRICLSPMDALATAQNNPKSEVVFLGIGFETTAPTIAATIKKAEELGISNFSVLTALKTMPQAMEALLNDQEVKVQGFICPGHVSAITGTNMYRKIVNHYHIPCVISGFEPTDLLKTILMLVNQIIENRAEVENQYTRTVKPDGNAIAQDLLRTVFNPADIAWRGLGVIPGSGLIINKKFAAFDTAKKYELCPPKSCENPGCICGDVMRGVKTPLDCKLFKKICHPENPVGACMVSAEGTCGVYYRYHP